MKYFFIILSLYFLLVEGEDAAITQFPHSVFLYVKCNKISWVCGASIVNQRIMLTAAHCVETCTIGGEDILIVTVGHRNKRKGGVSSVQRFLAHYFSTYNGRSLNDIALLKLKKSLKFNDRVQRVALMNPPYSEKAQLAGWGLVKDTDPVQETNELQYIDQYVWKAGKCKQVLKRMDKGTLCASSRNESSYVTRANSGGALLVRGYIQIGIVSYGVPSVSRSLTVYTSTGYYYNWIRQYSRKLYCEQTISDDKR